MLVSHDLLGMMTSARARLQVLVYHDLLGMMQHPHHAKVTPKFCKQYGAIGTAIQGALQQYRDEVRAPRRAGAELSRTLRGQASMLPARVGCCVLLCAVSHRSPGTAV